VKSFQTPFFSTQANYFDSGTSEPDALSSAGERETSSFEIVDGNPRLIYAVNAKKHSSFSAMKDSFAAESQIKPGT
jgi:hypothetical protein